MAVYETIGERRNRQLRAQKSGWASPVAPPKQDGPAIHADVGQPPAEGCTVSAP